MTRNNLTKCIYKTMTRWIHSLYDNLILAKSQRYVYINNILFIANVCQN